MTTIKPLLLTLLLAFTSVFAAKKDVCTLSGKIDNPVSDSVFVKNSDDKLIWIAKLDEKNSFKGSFEITTGYYTIGDGNEHTAMYLKPGFDLNIYINTKEFDESIQFSGLGASENQYIAKAYLFDEGLGKLNNYGYYAKLPEKGFLKLRDSIKTLEINLLNQNKGAMDKEFYSACLMKIDYAYRSKLVNYESMHKFLTNNKEFKVSTEFPDPFKGIDLNNKAWFGIYEYTDLLGKYIEDKASKDMLAKKSSEYYIAYLNYLKTEIKSTLLQEKFAYELGKYRLAYAKDVDSLYKRTMEFIIDTTKRNEIKSQYAILKNMKVGSQSTSFTFKDINGEDVSLESLKGKFVYIDIWATWCGPCIGEIPHLKKLEDTLRSKNIVFVSISMNDVKTTWEKMVVNSKLGGIQLFAENSKDPFFLNYLVSGIPRFILLDTDGKIIDANAKRPSDPQLLMQLLLLL